MFKGNMSKLLKQAQEMQQQIEEVQGQLSDMIVEAESGGGMVTVKVNGKQEVLEDVSIGERLKLVQAQLSKEHQALSIETEIKEKVQNEMGKTQRDYMLRQQLEAIRRELGESEDGEQEVEDLLGVPG